MVIALIVLLVVAGAALGVGAVFLLLGTAWAMLAGGVALIAFALALRTGLT